MIIQGSVVKIQDILTEDSVKYILYLNGRAAAWYNSQKEAEFNAKLISKKTPNTEIESKKEECTVTTLQAIKGQQGIVEGSGLDQEAGIGIDGQSFKFKIKDLVAFANKYPVISIDPTQFKKQIEDRDEDPAESMDRAKKAELKYPIIVVKRKNGQLWIADGTHRAHKAILNNVSKINAKVIPIEDMSKFFVKQGVSEAHHGQSCPHCGGEMVSEEQLAEKKDACYYKVKSRYKVWPSAYASGALVKCRKKGAANWGKSKK